MVNWLNGLLYGVGGLVCTCMVLLVTFQEKLVYVPVIPGMSKGYPITPARLSLQYEDVELHAADGVRLHSWFIKGRAMGPTIIFFQENAGNIAHRLEFVDILQRRLQCNVFLLSYRGYGASDGSPSQPGLTLDAQAALNHLRERHDIDTGKIFVFGRSLGGAVAANLVRNNPGKVCGLILENTFTSVLDMAGVMMPFLRWFIGRTNCRGPKVLNPFVRSPWSTVDVIGQIKEPILFLSGMRDEMIPPTHMRRLHEAATASMTRTFIEFPSGMHMDTWLRGGDRYWRVMQLFVERHGLEQAQESSCVT